MGGADTGSCSAVAPCATFRYAAARAAPGDTVLVESGTYPPQCIGSCMTVQGGQYVYQGQWIGIHGTAAAPITVKAVGSVILTRPSPASMDSQDTPLLYVGSSTYVVVDGFTLVGMKGRSDYFGHNPGNYLGEVVVDQPSWGSNTHNTIENLSVQHSAFTCIKTSDQESGDVIRGNSLLDCGSAGDSTEHGIYIAGPNQTVSGNTINTVSGYGIHCYQTNAAYPVDDEIITGNSVANVSYAGIYVGGAGETVTGNTVSGAKTNAILVGNGSSVIQQNIVTNSTYGITVGTDGTHPSFRIIDNTLYQVGTPNIGYAGSIAPTITVENNIFAGQSASVFNWSPPAGSLVDYNDYFGVSSGLTPGPHSIVSNPLFVNPGTDFHLRSGSPAVGAGTPLLLPDGGYTADLGALPTTA